MALSKFSKAFFSSAMEEFRYLNAPLFSAAGNPIALYRLLHQMGWDFDTIFGVDPARLSADFQLAEQTVKAISLALDNEDDALVVQEAHARFKTFIERIEKLYPTLMGLEDVAGTLDSIRPEHAAEFGKDIFNHLILRYLYHRVPLAFSLGKLFGLIVLHPATVIYPGNDPAKAPVRYPLERPAINWQGFLNPHTNPFAALIYQINFSAVTSLESLLQEVQRLFQKFRGELYQSIGSRGLDGMVVRLDATGLSLQGGNWLPFPEIDDPPITIRLSEPGSPELFIDQEAWKFMWLPNISQPDGSLVIFQQDWVKITLLPTLKTADGQTAPGLYLYENDNKAWTLEIIGGIGMEFPLDMLTDESGNSIGAGARGRLVVADGEAANLSIDEMGVNGNFRFGGPDGLSIQEAQLTIQGIVLPMSDLEAFPFSVRVAGKLILPYTAGSISAMLSFDKEQVHLRTSAELHLGNGIWLYPIEESRPVLEMKAKSEGVFAFSVAAIFKVPKQGVGVAEIEVSGDLGLERDGTGIWQIKQFSVFSTAQNLNWELPGGIQLRKAGVAIEFNNQGFTATLLGEVDLKNNQVVQLAAGMLFPDFGDPANIQIDALLQVAKINFFDQLYLFEGRLRLKVSTKPLTGSLEIIEGSGGFMARGILGQHPGLSDFHLTVDHLHTLFEFNTTGFELQVHAGTFLLPEVFNHGGSARATAGVGHQPINLVYENQKLVFQAALVLENLGVDMSENGEPGFTALVESAALSLSSSEPIPKIYQAKGEVIIPLPGRETLQIAFAEVEWDLSGYPTGSVYLAEDISFPLGGGFALILRGGMHNGIQTGLTVHRMANALPQFVLDGAVDLIIPVDMLTKENGDQIFIGSSGNISWQTNELPVPTLEELRIGGSFRLGGANGVRIQDGELAATGIAHMLQPSETQPFQLLLSGKIYLGDDGPGAGIQGASFTFTGADYPEFDFQGFYIRPGEELLGAVEQLPLKVREVEVNFIEPDPLPERLDPTNIRVTLSAELELPLPSGGSLLGMVDKISMHFNQHGIPIRKDGNPGIDIGGIGMGIDGFEAGGIVLTGVVYLGGLDNPEDLFFAGKLGGKFNGTGVTALLALGTKGPRGLCLEVSGGSAGISLAYGFMLTGAEGGVIFPNLDGRVSNADPCDIHTYIRLNDEGRPERTDQPPIARQEIPADEKVIGQPAVEAEEPEFECPQGACPPPAVSIISQPHPDRKKYPDRVILKFTSIDEPMLNQTGITPAFFAQLGLTTPDAIAEVAAGNLFELIEQGFPDLATLPLPPVTKSEVASLAEKLKADARNLLVQEFSNGISQALNSNTSVYDAVREMAYAGIPSPETTLKLTGSFSYAGVSAFLSITGGFSISTVMIPQPVPLMSTVGILGSINLLGIPMGTARLFMNMTDAGGTPLLMPTICGDVYAGIGPVEFGQLRMKFEAEGLTEGLANAGLIFAKHLSGPLITELVGLFAAEVLKHPDFDSSQPSSVFALLSFDQLVAFAGGLMNLPPERITPDIQACLVELMNNAWQSFNPQFLLCGQVQPKIFGFGLGSELASAKINISKTAFKAQFGFSPSYILSYYFGNIFPVIDKASVGMAFQLPDPVALVNKILTTDLGSLQQMTAYLQDGFDHVLENAVYTVEYELIPFGLKMADAEARLIMPDLLNHPARPNSKWKRPEDQTDKVYLSRLQLLLRALEVNVLADPLWKGSAGDLDLLTAHATHGLSMRDYFPHGGFLGAAKLSLPLVLLDGIPPGLMAEVFSRDSDFLGRFNAAKNILENYILKTENIGQLAFYVPFPNPPSFTIDGHDPTPMQIVKKMQANGLDWSDIQAGPLLSVEQAFFKGRIQNARILGVPVFEAQVTAYGPDAATQAPGRFEISAEVPAGSWLEQFVDRAKLQLTLSQAPARPIDEYFRELLALMQYHQDHSGRLANASAAVEIFSDAGFKGRQQRLSVGDYRARDLKIGNDQLSSIRIPADSGLQVILYEGDNFQGRNIVLTGSLSGLGNFDEIVSSIRVVRATPLENLQALITEGLPKMVLEARVDRMRIPDALSAFFRVQANTSLLIKAYSPFYNPNAVGNGLDAQLQRNGGIYFAFRGLFGVPGIFEIDIPNAQLALLPFSDTSLLPKVLGEFTANRIDIPLGLPGIEQGRIYFNSAPRRGENLLEIQGQLSHIPLGLLTLVPMVGNKLTASLVVSHANNRGDFNLSLSAVKIQEAGFIRSDLTLHGGAFNQPLTISSNSAWNAHAAGKRAAFFAGQSEVLRLLSGSTLSASVTGKGFSQVGMQLEIPFNVQLTAFPNHAVLKRSLVIPNRGRAILTLDSNGAFFLNAETSPFDFGLIRISGLSNGNLSIQLSQNGFGLPAGAQLHIKGLTQTPYSLNKMVIHADTTFTAEATGGKIGMAQFFEISGGKLSVSRTISATSISVESPGFYLFPATSFSNKLTIGNFSIDSNGYFSIDSTHQSLKLPGLLETTGRFVLINNHSGLSGKLENATVKLLPLNLSLSGSMAINSQSVQATLGATAFQVSGLIEISPASWQLDWQKQSNFSLKAGNPGLKILNISLVPKGQLVFNAQSDSSFALAFATNSNLNILSGLLEIGPATASLTKSNTSVYDLAMNAQVKALKNPVTGQWILSQHADVRLSNGNFKEEITALRNKTFVDVGMGGIYANNSSRTYFGRSGDDYYFEFSNLIFKVLGLENAVSGTCNASGSLSLQWSTAKELQLGPFRLPDRKAEVTMNLKSQSFSLKIPAGTLKAPDVTGFPSGGISIPQPISIGADGDFVANLSAFTLNGISLSTSGSDNYIELYGQDKVIKIRNKKWLWGANADLSLDIAANGSVSGSVKGSFKLSDITVGSAKFASINLGSATLTYSSSRSDFQFQTTLTLDNVSGQKKKTETKTDTVWDLFDNAWKTVTETVVSWVPQNFKIEAKLKYGSAGAEAEVKIR